MKAEEILKLPSLADKLSLLKKNGNQFTNSDIDASMKFYENEHSIRTDESRRDEIKDVAIVGADGKPTTKPKVMKKTRLEIPYARQIVDNAIAFIFGNEIDLILNNSNDEKNIESFNKFSDIWKKELRMQTVLRKACRTNCVETRCAVVFIVDGDRLRCSILSRSEGYNIWRHKDEVGRMDAVVVEYKKDKIVDGKIVNDVDTTEIWTADSLLVYEGTELVESIKNPTKKLNIAYFEQSAPEYWYVKDIIEKQDLIRSIHSDVNIRIANPAIVINGVIATKPEYDSDVKVYEINSPDGFDAGKSSTADIKYLELQSAPESVSLEMKNNERDIYRFTYPDFSQLITDSNFGNLSGQSIKLMFTQAYVKLAEKRETYDDMISRCISIVKNLASIVTGDKNINELDITFKYNSILPDSVSELVTMLVNAVSGGITTTEQAASLLAFNNQETIKSIAEKLVKENTRQVETAPTNVVDVNQSPKEINPPNKDGINGN